MEGDQEQGSLSGARQSRRLTAHSVMRHAKQQEFCHRIQMAGRPNVNESRCNWIQMEGAEQQGWCLGPHGSLQAASFRRETTVKQLYSSFRHILNASDGARAVKASSLCWGVNKRVQLCLHAYALTHTIAGREEEGVGEWGRGGRQQLAPRGAGCARSPPRPGPPPPGACG